MISSLFAGLMLLTAAVCGLTRHALLSKSLKAWPTIPPWAGNILFAVCVVQLGLGVKMISLFINGVPGVPPNAGPFILLLSGTVVVYHLTMLVNTIRQRREWALSQLAGAGFVVNPSSVKVLERLAH